MFASSLVALLVGVSLSMVDSAPVKTGVKLDPAATAEAHQRDDAATRAFTATEIKTSDGQCFFVDPTSGDFRENLTPVQIKGCDGSPAQKWDVITAGKHNNQSGFALIVSSLTNACLNFDPRRQAGNQVILFSCGGRANGEGVVTDSQLFPFNNGQTSLPFQPKGGNNKICLTPTNEGLLDQTTCSDADNQVFTFGSGPVEGSGDRPTPSSTPAVATEPSNSPIPDTSVPDEDTCSGDGDQIFTIDGSQTPPPAASSSTVSSTPPDSTPTPTPTPVSSQPAPGVRTGVKLDEDAVAEAHQRDDGAIRAFTGATIKTSDGQCLFVDPTSGDFRMNLTPVQIQPCNGSDGQKWDFITAGKHNDKPGFALIVSSLTNACLNFDPRRESKNQVLLFSCGGRADGSGEVQVAQLFPFKDGQTTLPLLPQNADNKVCLAPVEGLLDQTACSGAASAEGNQIFTIS